MVTEPVLKQLVWVGSSRKDFRSFPDEVKSEMGYALFLAQVGERHRNAKTLSGFGGAGVVEVVDDHRGDTFRTVYTVPVRVGRVRAPRLSEEVQERHCDTPG